MQILTCDVPSCDRVVVARGWCALHYGRWQRLGDVQADRPVRLRRSPAPGSACSVDSCEKPINAQGLCATHYMRLQRQGDAKADVPLRRAHRVPGAICTVPECGKPELSLDLCSAHYWRQHRHGHVLAGGRAQEELGSRCAVADCERPPVARKRCTVHYRKLRCAEDPAFAEAAKIYSREYKYAEYQRDPAYARARNTAWKRRNPARVKLIDAKKRHRRRAAPHIRFTVDQLAAKVAYWGSRCWVCWGAWDSIDHVKPINKGGWHALMNLRPICTPCNSRKFDKWPYPVSAGR